MEEGEGEEEVGQQPVDEGDENTAGDNEEEENTVVDSQNLVTTSDYGEYEKQRPTKKTKKSNRRQPNVEENSKFFSDL